jgi:beta-glucosidase
MPPATALMMFAILAQPAPALPQASTTSTPPPETPWMSPSLSTERRADLLIARMTLQEKITMMHGVSPLPSKEYVGYVPPNARLGIPALKLADGRAGVGNGAKNVTLLPAPIAAAASWDRSLMQSFGEVLGDEQWRKGTNVALAPSIDVIRVAQWGRSFESYGEDPYFNGEMAVAEVLGIQSEGPIADENMYLTMNQEDNRFKEDSVVDERTLQEIYLPPFERATKDAHVGTAMCAYVKTNGAYSCENAHLLQDLLKRQLDFAGWVMSDWGATHSTADSANHGLDQEMPGDIFFGAALEKAVREGVVSDAVLNEHVRRILVPMFRQGLFDRRQTGNWTADVRSAEHDASSRRVAEQGTVLLKNERGILPLSGGASIAVIGIPGSTKPKVEGGGSSWVEAPYAVSPLEGIRKRAGAGAKITYADGKDRARMSSVARAAELAIVFVNTAETEGADRRNLQLPDNQDQLISAVAAANPKTIVVLDTGGPVLMPWLAQVRGLLEAWYPGQEDGNAIAAILYGDVDPAAKLPLTFPRNESAIPTASPQQWPGVNAISRYDEKLNVGYRWYDATHTEPLFPFGFGLSYTSFRLRHLTISPRELSVSSGTPVIVTVDVTNTGQRDGAEVVQAYVGQPASNGEPPRQLRGFAKVELKPGETRHVAVTLDARAFSIYDTAAQRWMSLGGLYRVMVGSSSRDLPLHSTIAVHAATAQAGVR